MGIRALQGASSSLGVGRGIAGWRETIAPRTAPGGAEAGAVMFERLGFWARQ